MHIVELLLLVNVLKSALCETHDNYDPLKYSVPEPLIQAFRPRGLEVSIPHTPGIQLFAFHGNINKPMDGLDAGQLSKDILTREGPFWKFRDASIELKLGDTIYFWLFVIKNKLGYRYDDGVHHVTNFSSGGISAVPEISQSGGNVGAEKNNGDFSMRRACESVLVNLTQTHLNLEYELNSLRETNRIYEDLIGKHPQTATKLVLVGRLPTNSDALYTVLDILRNKLNLPGIEVEKAERNEKNGGINFYVATLAEKITVIKRAKEKLQNSLFNITY